jgi:hypothetical protein
MTRVFQMLLAAPLFRIRYLPSFLHSPRHPVARCPFTRLRMTDNPDKNGMNPNLPPVFVHTNVANGLTISTCLLCKKVIGSPTLSSLRMAEENHLCACTGSTRKSR